MPTYKFECPYCGATERETRKVEDRNKPKACGCGCKVSMTRVYVMPFISATVNPTSRPETAEQLKSDKKWDADMAAYKRMRKNGVQPRGITNAAKLEKGAETQTELKMGRLLRKRDVRDGVDLSSHMLQKDLEA